MGAQERGVLRPVADAVRLVTRADATLRRQANLSLRAGLVLAALDHGPRRVGAVARDAALSPPTASHVLERLEAAGLIVRTPAADDRRAVEVQLTPAGRARRDEVNATLGGLVPALRRDRASSLPDDGGTTDHWRTP